MTKKIKIKELTFEEHLDNAKDIIKKLESGDCNLDEMLNLYEDAVQSIKHCNKKLTVFEDKIKLINKKSDNTYEIDEESWELVYM